VDGAVKSRHAECVGDTKKYWDYRECCWVPYDAGLEEAVVPARVAAEHADADDATAVETAR